MDKNIEELLSRGVSEVIDEAHLKSRLEKGDKLRVKLGIDPTSPNIHIGRAILLWKLRAFQDLGHTAVFIIGDATGVVGDTSDKDSERPMLDENVVKENMDGYFAQALKILDKDKTEVHYNSEWLDKLNFNEVVKMANLFSLHEFQSREMIAKRLEAGQRVSLHETLYPLMQGYDSVAIKADVELGGTDQRFNLLTGRRIQPLYGQEPQDILMTEIIEGLDGRKMSSSWGNVINLTDSPKDMFGKTMSLNDELVEKYFTMCTKVPLEEVEEIMKLHPKEAKVRLAREFVSMYHDEESAERAEADFNEAFSKDGIPDEIDTVDASKGEELFDVVSKAGLVSSKTEWRRLVTDGAVKNLGDDTPIEVDTILTEDLTLKIGKHRFIKIKVR